METLPYLGYSLRETEESRSDGALGWLGRRLLFVHRLSDGLVQGPVRVRFLTVLDLFFINKKHHFKQMVYGS